jgi:hypothetical protein
MSLDHGCHCRLAIPEAQRRDLVITYGNDSIGAPLQQYERMAIP